MPQSFLERAGWAEAHLMPMAADYSTRHFARLEKDGQRAILMRSAPDQKTREFIAIDRLLCDTGLSAPKIYAADEQAGCVLMEDFGAVMLGQQLDQGADADTLYRRATDVQVHLHNHFDEQSVAGLDLPVFNAALFTEQLGPCLDFFFPRLHGRSASEIEREGFFANWRHALAFIDDLPRTLLLRDYMLDNLMDLPERSGVSSVGIIDFQDGGLGPIAYDLASLAESARRPVPLARLDFVLDCYCAQRPHVDALDLRRAALLLAAQRHTRILGTFSRYGKDDLLPGMLAYLKALAADPALAFTRSWIFPD